MKITQKIIDDLEKALDMRTKNPWYRGQRTDLYCPNK